MDMFSVLFFSVRCLIDALTMLLFSCAGHAVYACTDHYILHRKVQEITMVKCAANTFTKVNFNRCFRGKAEDSASESLWNFKRHGKLRLKHRIHK